MAVAARRGHPACATCKAPTSVRAQIAQRARRGDSLRSISEYAVNEGHALGKDGIGHHLRNCVGITDTDQAESQSRSMRVASIVGYVVRGLSRLSNDIAEELSSAELTDEAAVVQQHLPESNRRALEATAGTPTAELLASRCLAIACNKVLRVAHPEVSREIARVLAEEGADVLASDLLWLSEQATAHVAATATTDRQSEARCSPPAAGAPPAASDNEEAP